MSKKTITTDKQVAAAPIGRHGLGKGLTLDVKPSGRQTGIPMRYWTMRYTSPVTGKRRWAGLGTYPEVSLAQANKARMAFQEAVAAGSDPLNDKRVATARAKLELSHAKDFAAITALYIAAKTPEWSNPKSAAQWTASMDNHALPHIGTLLPDEITLDAAEAMLRKIWLTLPETASRVRGRCEAIWNYAKVKKWAHGENPFRWRGQLDALLPAAKKVRKPVSFRALHHDQIGKFVTELRQHDGMGTRALEFVILTAGRSAEIREATWKEIDLDSATWVIPPERMKARREHRVPLSRQAMKVLEKVKPEKVDPDAYVFPSPTKPGRPLSDMTLGAVIERMGYDATAHGMRSCFRGWSADISSYPRDLCEQALAHTLESKAEAAYKRTDVLERRRPMMQDWADWTDKVRPAKGQVVKLHAQAVPAAA
jgi:integrase